MLRNNFFNITVILMILILQHIVFDMVPIDISWFLQLMSKDDFDMPFSSILYLHSQPPLLNLIYKTSFDFFDNSALIFGINTLCAAINMILVLRIISDISESKILPLVCMVIYGLLPENIMYQMWGYSSFLCATLLLIHFYSFWMIVRDYKVKRYLVAFVTTFVALSLLRQTYHPIFMILPALFFICYLKNRGLYWFLLPILALLFIPASIWSYKNYLYFDMYTMSSWQSRNLFRMASIRLNDEQKIEALKEGCNPILMVDPFLHNDVYKDYIVNTKERRYDLQPLGVKGSNSETYLMSSLEYKQAFDCLIVKYPYNNVKSLIQAWGLYFTPVSDYVFLEQKESTQWQWAQIYNRLFLLQLHSDKIGEPDIKERLMARSPIVILQFLFICGSCMIGLTRLAANKKLSILDWLFIYGGYLVVWNSLSNFFDAGENMRFRYDVNFIYYICYVFILNKVIYFIQRNLSKD